MIRTSNVRFAILLPLAAVALSGCDKFEARMEFKKGNGEYRNESYRAAIEDYQKGLALDPAARQVWRSVGLAAMAVYRPGDKAADNLKYAQIAIDAFGKYLAAFPDDDQVREYLLTTLLNSERYDEALKSLESEAILHPGNARIEDNIVTVLVKAKRFDEAAARLDRLGGRASFESLYALGVACWDKAYRDPSLDPVARGAVVERGIAVLRRAVGKQPDSFDGNVYLNLILREKAKLEPDPVKQQQIIQEAITFQDKAKALAQAKRSSPAA